MTFKIKRILLLVLMASGAACSNGVNGFEALSSDDGSTQNETENGAIVRVLDPELGGDGSSGGGSGSGGGEGTTGGSNALTDRQAESAIRATYMAILMRQPVMAEINFSLASVKNEKVMGMRTLARDLASQLGAWYAFRNSSNTHIIQSLYSGFLNRCGEKAGVVAKRQDFWRRNAHSSRQNYKNWLNREIDNFLFSPEFSSSDVMSQIINGDGKTPVCAWGLISYIDYTGIAWAEDVTYLYPYVETYSGNQNQYVSATINIQAIGGNGNVRGKFSHAGGGPYNFTLGHDYVLSSDSLRNEFQFFHLEARSAGRVSNRMFIDFNY